MTTAPVTDDRGAEIVSIARRLMPTPAGGQTARRRVVPILRSEVRAAGTSSDAFNGKIVRETVSAVSEVDDPDLAEAVAETVAGLRDIAPANAREAMLAAQLIATHTATMDSLALARSALSGPLRDAHLAHAARLAHAHAALSEALDRIRRGDRRVVVVEYRRGSNPRVA
jgi:hypothetical protein